MKKQLLFIAVALLASIHSFGQCSSCTTTITGTDAANHIINAGTTFCISPTGTCSGLITVSGGTLCNQGHITSSNVWVTGATSVFDNYGTVTSSNILIDNGAHYTNTGTATIDSLLVSNSNSAFSNTGSMTNIRIAFNDNATGTNNGHITTDYFGDSLATFSNLGYLTINFDFYNAYNSHFGTRGGWMDVGRDWYNSTGSTFIVGCMLHIGRDWYNSATVTTLISTAGSCGGFNITGLSLNSGTIASPGPNIDICDAGHPIGGVDGNTGTIDASTTYCTCTNTFCTVAGITELSKRNLIDVTLFPNPATGLVSVSFNYSQPEQVKLEVTDMTGKKRLTIPMKTNAGENKTSLDVSSLASGLYVLSIVSSEEVKGKQALSVVK